MSRFVIFILLLTAALPAMAEQPTKPFPRVTFGIETYGMMNFATFRHVNFISAEGYRVNMRDMYSEYTMHGQVQAGVGCNVSKYVNISLFGGLAGIYKRRAVIPVSLRGTVYFGDNPLEDRWFMFTDAGAGFAPGRVGLNSVSAFGRVGAGYRFSLTRSIKVDILMCYQFVYTRPDVTEDIEGLPTEVAPGRIRRSLALINSLSFGVGLVF